MTNATTIKKARDVYKKACLNADRLEWAAHFPTDSAHSVAYYDALDIQHEAFVAYYATMNIVIYPVEGRD